MKMHIYEYRARVVFELQRLNANMEQLLRKVDRMSQATDSLQAAVERETEVEKSAVTLIQGLADQVRQTSTDPQVQALADRINANAGALAAAVAANTPAAQSAPQPATADAPAAAPASAPDTGGL